MKKILVWIAFILVLFIPLTVQAQNYVRSGQLSQTWNCSLVGLAATLTECQAIPSSSTDRHYITDIFVQVTTTTSGTFQIRSGTGTNCGTAATLLFPAVTGVFNAPPNTTAPAVISFVTPIRSPAGDAICVIGEATDETSIQIQGFLAR